MAAEEGGRSGRHTRTDEAHARTGRRQTRISLGGTPCVGGGTCGPAGAVGAAETRPRRPVGRGGYWPPPSPGELPVGPAGHVTEGSRGNSGEGCYNLDQRAPAQTPGLGTRSRPGLPFRQRASPDSVSFYSLSLPTMRPAPRTVQKQGSHGICDNHQEAV